MNIIWFRSDLRVDDNPALFHACASEHKQLLAVYFTCSAQDRAHALGENFQALRNCGLKNLKKELKKINIKLLVIESDNYERVCHRLVYMCARFSVRGIFYNEEYAYNEWQRDAKLEKKLSTTTSIFKYNGDSLLPPQSILNKSGNPYKVYTPFANSVKQIINESSFKCYPIPNQMPPENLKLISCFAKDNNTNNLVQSMKLNDDKGLVHLDNIETVETVETVETDSAEDDNLETDNSELSVKTIPIVEENYLREQLMDFLSNDIITYRESRDFPFMDTTSKLSFGLSIGALSVRRCFKMAKEFTLSSSSAWLNELIWRDFYRSIMVHFPKVSMNQAFNDVDKRITWSNNDEQFEQWKSGETGVPLIDAAMKQLVATRWMHNRLRMVTASYLCKNLWHDWRKGERFFAKHLFDYDFASNNGGWQWCASVGTDAAPYYRVFNPAIQQKKFDPGAKFIKKWIPSLLSFTSKEIHQFESKDLNGYHPLLIDLKDSRKLAIESFKQALL